MSPAIATSALRRVLGGRAVVDRIDLRVDAGSVYGFLGPNGAGKTTTIRLLLGLLRPTSGSIHILGKPMPGQRLSIARDIGALVETPTFYDHLTGLENLEITRRLIGCAKTETARVLELVDLRRDAGKRAGTYSLGMRQRLGIARALIGSPRLVLLDEPTNGLDPQGIRDMRDLIRSLPLRAGATVLMSSHLLTEVEQMATHVGLMDRGRLIAQGPIDEITSSNRKVLEIGVRRAAEAARLLPSRDLAIRVEDSERLSIRLPVKGAADIAAVNRRLVEGGFDVSHLAVRAASLEDIFMQMTANTADRGAGS